MSEIREARLQKANTLISKGFASYAESFVVSHPTKFLLQKFDYLESGQEEDFPVSVAGRVMAKRVMGKIAFFTISDQEGQIQLYLDKRIINLNLEKLEIRAFSINYRHLKILKGIQDLSTKYQRKLDQAYGQMHASRHIMTLCIQKFRMDVMDSNLRKGAFPLIVFIHLAF